MGRGCLGVVVLAAGFEAAGWQWRSVDRGYGTEDCIQPSWSELSQKRLLICHSLGPHLLPPAPWRQLMPSCCSAACGLRSSGSSRRRQTIALQAMASGWHRRGRRDVEDISSALRCSFAADCSAASPVLNQLTMQAGTPARRPASTARLQRLRLACQVRARWFGGAGRHRER